MTRTILQGPAAVKYAGYTYYTEGDVTLTPQTQLRTIESSLHGPVSHRQTDRAVEVAFTPVGMLDSKDAYYPHGPAKLGALLAPGTDAPVYVHTAAGVKLTLKAGVVTRMPDLRLGAGLGPLGEMAITAMGGLGKATGEDESVWESESASLPADSLDASKILTPGYLLKLKSGSTTVHTLDAVEGIEVSLGARIEPGGDMYRQHMEFIEWAKSYDTGDLRMRSRAKHDAWQTLLPCPILRLDGADSVDDNFQKVRAALHL